jgi:NAD(P)-dependent dehydrogenase (short-subunit alcohol dehydrogenase family)
MAIVLSGCDTRADSSAKHDIAAITRRFGKPTEVADAVLFLASSSDMICGHDLLLDGGYTAL